MNKFLLYSGCADGARTRKVQTIVVPSNMTNLMIGK
jgi:hypothetical protein